MARKSKQTVDCSEIEAGKLPISMKEEIQKQEEYWLNLFVDEIPVLNLPVDYPRPSIMCYEGARIEFPVEKELTQKITILAEKCGNSLNETLLATYYVLLQKYTGQEDIVVGSPLVGRREDDLGDVHSKFLNILALRNQPRVNKTFREFLIEVKENTFVAFEHQDYQIEMLAEKLQLQNHLSRIPFFDVCFLVQNQRGIPDDLTIKDVKSVLLVQVFEVEEELQLSFEYSIHLFKDETIQRMAGHFIHLLKKIVEDPQEQIAELQMITEEEKHTLLDTFNQTIVDYPKDKTIHQLFEEQVRRNPNQIAVVSDEQMLTYRELNEKANQLAHCLRNSGVGLEEMIGILVEPSLEMFIGVMAILKAGGTYVPIDPAYPVDRVRYMLDDSQARILLTDLHERSELEFTGQTINLKDPMIYSGDSTDLEPITSQQNLAYVIYTSGSTGKPKGVMIEHRSLVNFSYWYINSFAITAQDRTSKYARFGFDASICEIFPYLIVGATVFTISSEIRLDIQKLNQYFEENQITISFLPTQFCEQFIQLENRSLTRVITGGDKLKEYIPQTYTIINAYGPTESTVLATSFLVDKSYHNIPIGKPIGNTQVLILSKENHLQPIGVPGELCISGDGLARGYLNRPELTKEKFTSNPFVPDVRMYKSGDLARWLEDGNIEFLGRIDYQVKIRGYRIELGEIESQLLQCVEIKEAVVIDREDRRGMKYLVAYIVSEQEIPSEDLHTHLAKELPDYMIPTYFIQLEKMPLTANGKIDKRALPEPNGREHLDNEWIGPSTEAEKKLAEIWSELLGVEKIGVLDNFFMLGGHSLKANQLVLKINKLFDVNLQIKDIFDHSTIQELAIYISYLERGTYVSIEPVDQREYYPASSAQKRLFALRQIEGDRITYNIPLIWSIEGKLNRGRLENAIRELVARHESFRTYFDVVDGEPVQKILPEIDFEIPYCFVQETDVDQVINDFIQPFDLTKAPLFRFKLIESNNKYLFMLDIHHSITDGSSVDILLKELAKLYEDKEVSELRIQYKDFTIWQNQLFQSERMKSQREYWLNLFADEIPVLNLPTDYPRPSNLRYEGAKFEVRVGKELTHKITELSKNNGATLYMTLLAVYYVLLQKYSGQEDITVGSPIAGRRHADLENVCGMFVNTLALRNQPMVTKTFSQFLIEVKKKTLAAFENQDYQFEMLVEKLHLQRDLSRHPLFDVSFIVQNANELTLQMQNLRMIPYDYMLKVAKFDLLLQVFELKEGLQFSFEYSTDLFKDETIQRMAAHFVHLLKNIVENPEEQIAELQMITGEEREKLLYSFNDTSMDYPRNQTICQLFEEQSKRNPNQIAVVSGEQKLTYRELNEKANQLAHFLRGYGVGLEEMIGILVEPSLEMFIGVMAILKVGGGYVPIDTSYPVDRIRYMLDDSQARILLTDLQEKNELEFAGKTINLKDPTIYSGDSTDLEPITNQQNLAYVIYTSGSTGKPKGVMIEHRSLVNFSYWYINSFAITAQDRTSKYARFGFDASICEIFPYLIVGATVYAIPSEIRLDIQKLNQYFEENQITISFLPTQLCEQFIQLENRSLTRVITGGDKLKEYIPQTYAIINGYGPTESTVLTTSFLVDRSYHNIPIGKPNGNIQIYIISKENQLQPIGVPGELCISGDGLARGYLNRPELTKEKFVSNPFVSETRMYKSGDLARWLEDGNIEFLGRIDHQVKIRGYRIELGEIESQLLQCAEIKEAAVIAREDNRGMKYLVAYIVSEQKISLVDLRTHLVKELPDYMIPTNFIQLEVLPLTSNGKVDTKKLAKREDNLVDHHATYLEPQNEIEENLMQIWKAVLDVEQIGILDNFFNLGGHSITAIKVVTRALAYGWQITVQDLFNYPTIQGLAVLINKTIAKEIILEIIVEETDLDITYHPSITGFEEVAVSGECFEIENVLLTGVTGYLGIHLLEQLLLTTDAKIYCLVRGETEENSKNRLLELMNIYFGDLYDQWFGRRILIVKGDLIDHQFGLSKDQYLALGKKIDTVIHPAALVKHFGDYADFEKVNVMGTKKVIEFALQFGVKVNHVSTMSVSGEVAKGDEDIIFTENDFYVGQDYMSNVYVKSKFEAEKLIFKAMEDGLVATIYRVGNLTGRYRDGHFQVNIEANAFYNRLRSIIYLRCISEKMLDQAVELTPIDYCSKAIVEIMNKKESKGRAFHLQNHQMKLADVLMILEEMNIKIRILTEVSFNEYINQIAKDDEGIELILGWMHSYQSKVSQNSNYTSLVSVDSGITVKYLKEIGFEWPTIDQGYLKKVLAYMKKVKFIV